MALNAPSVSNNASDSIEKVATLSHEAVTRVANFVAKALEDPGKMKTVVQDGFATLFRQNPQFEIKAISAFYEKYKGQLATMPILERLKSLEWVTKMFERIFSQSAKDTLNIPLDNALKAAKSGFENKQASLHRTYHGVQDDLSFQVTGNSFPTA